MVHTFSDLRRLGSYLGHAVVLSLDSVVGYEQLQLPLEAIKMLLTQQQQRARRCTARWGTIVFSRHLLLRRCGARALAVAAALSGGGGGRGAGE
jgi:hypothetical protein